VRVEKLGLVQASPRTWKTVDANGAEQGVPIPHLPYAVYHLLLGLLLALLVFGLLLSSVLVRLHRGWGAQAQSRLAFDLGRSVEWFVLS
jgi:hypothetical protein